MTNGRLIRVRRFPGDPMAALYVVVASGSTEAISLLREGLSRPADEYEDLGLINDTLVTALDLTSGGFARI